MIFQPQVWKKNSILTQTQTIYKIQNNKRKVNNQPCEPHLHLPCIPLIQPKNRDYPTPCHVINQSDTIDHVESEIGIRFALPPTVVFIFIQPINIWRFPIIRQIQELHTYKSWFFIAYHKIERTAHYFQNTYSPNSKLKVELKTNKVLYSQRDFLIT